MLYCSSMIYKSPLPPVSIPVLDLPTFIFKHAEDTSIVGKDQETPALIKGNSAITFRELKELSVKFASGLVNNLGLGPGDVVAVVIPNTIYYPVVTFGTQMMGGICMTTNPEYNVLELEYQFKLTEPRAIVAEPSTVSTIIKALQRANLPDTISRIITIDNDNLGGDYWSLSSMFLDIPFERIYITTQEEQSRNLAFILFSSGTSGSPKGVMLSHRNIVANVMQYNEFERHDEVIKAADEKVRNHRYTVFLPLFHSYALVLVMHTGLSKGGTMLLMHKYSLQEFCILSQKYKATIGYLVPPVILDLVKEKDEVAKYDLSSYVFFNSSAAPLSRELHISFQSNIGVPLSQGYGLSEMSPACIRAPINSVIFGSVGFLLPNIDAKIIDGNGHKLGVNEVGEICIRGPNVMVGYLKNPQATRDTIDDEGFLHTGDVGYIDKKGNFYISDRKKELIKYKGFQVPPAELEGILTDHPAVLDCAVIPVYDESRASEIPKAFVVVHPNYNTFNITNEIREWVDSQVTSYKRLRGGVEIIEQIPKSASGKILRRVLKDREESKQARQSLQAKL